MASKAMVYCDHLRGWDASTPGRAALSSRANCLNWLLDLGAKDPLRMQAMMPLGAW